MIDALPFIIRIDLNLTLQTSIFHFADDLILFSLVIIMKRFRSDRFGTKHRCSPVLFVDILVMMVRWTIMVMAMVMVVVVVIVVM